MDKLIIYQIFTRLFGNHKNDNISYGTLYENGSSKFNNLNNPIIKKISDLGVTHIWLTGVIRHATTTSYSSYGIPDSCPSIVKGLAGSPYAITDYYDVDPDLAEDVSNRMAEFESLVERIHKLGLKVIIDFVPNHVARQYHSIAKPEGVRDLGEDDDKNMGFTPSNNFYYCVGQSFNPSFNVSPYTEYPARVTGNDKFDASPSKEDWYETVKLNYGVDYCDASGRSEHFDPIPNTWLKMRDILMYWAAKGIDGVRCDMAEMVPPAFWSWVTPQLKDRFPGFIFIGEVYNPSLYRTYISSGFDYLYDKVGMYDCMRNVICGKARTPEITKQWQSTDDIYEHMLYFLENHDEQRIASKYFANDPYCAFPAVTTCLLMRNNPFMIYAGQEFGESGMCREGFSGYDGRTSIFDYWSPDTLYRGYVLPANSTRQEMAIRRFYKNIIHIAKTSDAVKNGDFFDLMYANPKLKSCFTFLRKSEKELLFVIAKFDKRDSEYNIVIPSHAFDFLNIKEGEYEAEDLLPRLSVKYHIELIKDKPIHISMKGLQSMILRINL